MRKWLKEALRPLTALQDAEYRYRLEDRFAKERDKPATPPCEGKRWFHTGSHLGCDDDDDWD